MNLIKNHSLQPWNTFGIAQQCDAFVSVDNTEELKKALKHPTFENKFILGGGSNLLLTQKVKGLCIHIGLKGITRVKETEEYDWIEIMAGENWHECVLWSLKNGYGGIENLALIPGNVGTAPIQNIGAYGVELKDVFVSCNALNRITLEEKVFDREEIAFGYRNSIFKTHQKDQWVITKVTLVLTKKNHTLRTHYGAIAAELGEITPSPKTIANAVISIRQSKLPDPKKLGNSGSFFKNPIVPKTHYNNLLATYPDLPNYPAKEGYVKIPAGWLIDQLGLKGYRKGDAGVHKKQALVLVNYGKAEGREILALAHKIQKSVKDRFNVELEAEVNIL